MFVNLPEAIKSEVLSYLQANNFPQAKAVYNAWIERNEVAFATTDVADTQDS